MNDRVRIGTRVNAKLWDRFREDVASRRGGTRGILREEVENALREYMLATDGGDTHDRLSRLENRQKEILDILEGKGGDTEDGSKCVRERDSSLNKTTLNRLDKIESRIDEKMNGDLAVEDRVVENAIEDIAGSSRNTLSKYKRALKRRRVAFEWPTGGRWFVDGETFVQAVDNALPEHISDIEEEYGRDWVNEKLPDECEVTA